MDMVKTEIGQSEKALNALVYRPRLIHPHMNAGSEGRTIIPAVSESSERR